MARRTHTRLRHPAIPAALAATALFSATLPSLGSVADAIIPGEFSEPVALELGFKAERTAEAHARYIVSIMEEENGGPEAALLNKHRVLAIDPGFSALAVDVARHHLQRGDTAEAISVLKDAAKAAPAEPEPCHARGTIHLRQLRKPVHAEKYAIMALEASPDRPGVYELLRDIHRANGTPRKFEAILDRAAARPVKDPEFWLALADLRLRDSVRPHSPAPESVSKKTTPLLEKAIQHAPADATILARAADAFMLCGKTNRAADLYREALAKNRRIEGLREKLANCLLETGRKQEAAKLLREIVAENPLNLSAYDHLARLQSEQGEYGAAVASMRQAMLIAPIDPRRHEEIIRTSLRAGDHETALLYAADAEKRFPYLTGFSFLRAVALSEAGEHSAALMAFERAGIAASNHDPELLDSSFFMAFGAAAERAGHYTKAAELLKKAIELDPENSADACNHLGYMWAERNENLAEAEQLIRRALEQEPDNGAYVDSLGWVFYRQGRYTEALEQLLRAAELLEKPDPVVLDHIGDAYAKLGKPAEALSYWRKAAELDPENPAIAAKIDSAASSLAGQ